MPPPGGGSGVIFITSSCSAAPWWRKWCDIYNVIVLSQPWFDLLVFEDLFARNFAKFSVDCRLLDLPEHHAAGDNAQLQLVIATR